MDPQLPHRDHKKFHSLCCNHNRARLEPGSHGVRTRTRIHIRIHAALFRSRNRTFRDLCMGNPACFHDLPYVRIRVPVRSVNSV